MQAAYRGRRTDGDMDIAEGATVFVVAIYRSLQIVLTLMSSDVSGPQKEVEVALVHA